MPPKSTTEKLTSLWLHGLTLTMASVASYSYLLLEAEEHAGSFSFMMWVLIELGMMFVAAWYFRGVAKIMGEMPVIIPLLVMVMLGSYVYEILERLIFGTGHPFEYLVTCSLKNVLLAAAACGCWIRYQRLAVAGGLFIILFCLTISPQPGIVLLSISYVILGVIWLIMSYWHNISLHFARKQQQQSPRWVWGFLAVLLLILVSTISFRSQEVVQAMSGFMPSSGGSGHHDHHARGGVGDGDALVAGKEDIKSFAPLEDAPFKSSEEPSLYDVFDDTFEEKCCPVHKKNERAIPLAPQFSKQVAEQMAKSKQLNKTFSTLRQKTTTRKQGMKDLESHAIMFVAGRTPLHLRMETYELFDGQDWFPEDDVTEDQHGYEIKEIQGLPWLMIKPESTGFAESMTSPETHAIKVINLKSNRIPAPLHVSGIHIDKLTDPTFYKLARKDIIALNRESIPELQPIHLSSSVFLPDKLHELSVGRGKHNDINLVLPQLQDMDRIKALAQSWTTGLPSGWLSIKAVLNKLRTEYEHAPDQLVSDTGKIARGEIPCAEFLFNSKRGPDYQFATSMVLMLRSLGYSCRLASGFYASPARYNTKSKHTEVLLKDAHVWVELYLGAGRWVTLEPTPGYEVLGPPPTTFETLVASINYIFWWIAARSASITFILMFAGITWLFRNHLIDGWLIIQWNLFPQANSTQQILKLNQILTHRFATNSLGPHPGDTHQRWCQRIAHLEETSSHQLVQFAKLVNWANFAPTTETSPPDLAQHELQEISRRLLKKWTINRIRQLKLKHQQQLALRKQPTLNTI